MKTYFVVPVPPEWNDIDNWSDGLAMVELSDLALRLISFKRNRKKQSLVDDVLMCYVLS